MSRLCVKQENSILIRKGRRRLLEGVLHVKDVGRNKHKNKQKMLDLKAKEQELVKDKLWNH